MKIKTTAEGNISRADRLAWECAVIGAVALAACIVFLAIRVVTGEP